MKRIESKLVTLEDVYIYTGSFRGLLELSKKVEENIKTQNLYSVFCVSKCI